MLTPEVHLDPMLRIIPRYERIEGYFPEPLYAHYNRFMQGFVRVSQRSSDRT